MLADPVKLAVVARRLRPLRGEQRLSPLEAQRLGAELAPLLAQGRWVPEPASVFFVRRPGRLPRVLASLKRRDRVVLRATLEVLYEARLVRRWPTVVGYVRGGGALDLVGWLGGRLRVEPAVWALDVVDFFPSVDLDHLAALVMERVPWPAVQAVILAALAQPRVRGGRSVAVRGIVQGSPLSPWLSNLYLEAVDAVFAGPGYGRFSDNVFLVGGQGAVQQMGARLVAALGARGLRVRVRPSVPASAEVGVDCLGYRVSRAGRWASESTRRSLLVRLAARIEAGAEASARALIRGHRAYFDPPAMEQLMKVDALLQAGRFAEALALIRAESEAAAPDDLVLSAGETAAVLQAVGGDPVRHVEEDGAVRRVVGRGVDEAVLVAHRGGAPRQVLPVDRLGFAHVGVLDVDPGPGADGSAGLLDAQRLAQVARGQGLRAVVEATGGRGHHVWLPQDRPEVAGVVAARLACVESEAGAPPAGVRRERMPDGVDGDPSVRLPLGVHPSTGRRSRVLGADGVALRSGVAVAAALSEAPSVAGTALAGCRVLRGLAERARETGHLNHHERWSLAATLGHVDAGAVHRIIAHCENYDAVVTQGFLDRRAPRMMGCARLRERHPEWPERCPCPVRRGRGYACPVGQSVTGRSATGQRARKMPGDEGDLARLMAGLQRSLARLEPDQ